MTESVRVGTHAVGMLYFFTSSLHARYRNDALLSLAYPRGHVIKFRYSERIVDQRVLEWCSSGDGTIRVPSGADRGFIVFADYVGDDFLFYPLRGASLVRLWKRGMAYYAALRLEDYVCYKNEQQPHRFRAAVDKIDRRPKPRISEEKPHGEGYFLLLRDDLWLAAKAVCASESDADSRWHDIVEALCNSPNLNDTLFYRIRGIYKVDRERETLIQPAALYAESRYTLWIDQNYVLKILSYMPGAYKEALEIEINSSQKEGAVVTPEKITVLNRYDEERILIGCKRVLDRTLTPIWIKNSDGANQEKLRIAEGYLLAQVEVRRRTIAKIVILLGVAALLISVGPDMVTGVIGLLERKIESKDATQLAILCKTLGTIISLVAGYTAFRKIPIGK